MVHCRECGEMISESAPTCPKCGATQNVGSAFGRKDLDPNTGLNIVSFLWPVVGLILYCVYNDDSPRRAKACGKWALISTICYFIIIITVILIVALSDL